MPEPQLAGAKSPGFRQAIDVARRYLRQGGVLQAMLTAAVVRPVIVWAGNCGRCGDQRRQEDAARKNVSDSPMP
ncbi:MAG: hypothetical protein ACE5FV_02225 [Woeseia sp.]